MAAQTLDALVLVEWTLTRIDPDPLGVVPVDFPDEVNLRISADHVLSAHDGCNGLSGRLDHLDSGILHMAEVVATLVGCSGLAQQVQNVVRRVLTSSPTWTVEENVLVLRSTAITLTYRRRPSIFPSDRPGRPGPLVVAEGHRATADYRFMYAPFEDRVCFSGELREAPGEAWRSFLSTFDHDAAAGQPQPDQLNTGLLGGERYLVGLVAPPVGRIVLTPLGGSAVELPLIPLPQAPPGYFAFVGFFAPFRRGSTVSLYDGAGHQTGDALAIDWWEPGDPA